MARRNGHEPKQSIRPDTSKHPAIVEMNATIDKLKRQLTLDDFLEAALAKMRSAQKRNLALQGAFCDLDIDLLDPRSEESETPK
jgi:hypothetical protein